MLFCTLFAGWQSGIAAWLGSTAIVLLTTAAHTTGTAAASGVAVFLLAGGIQTAIAAFARAMLFDREIVVSGLRHRLKNLMAVVEALARYSAPRSGTDAAIDDYLERFSGRLHALTAANEVALTGKPRDVEAGALVRATLAPFMSDPAPRIRVEGPSLQLSEELGGGLALAVYELATNAIRYGALSVPQGYVTFVWSKGDSATGEHVLFDWKERGGPAPLKPDREGFGMRMIRTVTARESAGKVDFDYEPDGLHCRIDLTRVPAKPRKA